MLFKAHSRASEKGFHGKNANIRDVSVFYFPVELGEKA